MPWAINFSTSAFTVWEKYCVNVSFCSVLFVCLHSIIIEAWSLVDPCMLPAVLLHNAKLVLCPQYECCVMFSWWLLFTPRSRPDRNSERREHMLLSAWHEIRHPDLDHWPTSPPLIPNHSYSHNPSALTPLIPFPLNEGLLGKTRISIWVSLKDAISMLARQWLALSSPVPKQVGVLAILPDPCEFSGL